MLFRLPNHFSCVSRPHFLGHAKVFDVRGKEPGMAMPGFITTIPPGREHHSGSTIAVNASIEFEPALDGTCVQNCQTSWSTCISSCQWWEWLVE